jgi:hypothetical protein
MLGGQAVTNSSQYILNRPARWRVIENLGGGDERKAITLRPLAQPRLLATSCSRQWRVTMQ